MRLVGIWDVLGNPGLKALCSVKGSFLEWTLFRWPGFPVYELREERDSLTPRQGLCSYIISSKLLMLVAYFIV